MFLRRILFSQTGTGVCNPFSCLQGVILAMIKREEEVVGSSVYSRLVPSTGDNLHL